VRVALYVTCLVDQVWPQVGTAAVKLLRHAGCSVHFDTDQTCCGQPACNSGWESKGIGLAQRTIEQFERSGAEALVVPSGSCAAQIHHYPALFPADSSWRSRAIGLAGRTFELGTFLLERRGLTSVPGRFEGSVGWHDACHGLRDLGIREQPRKLLRMVPGLRFHELPAADACCGFGGTFSVKYPDVSVAIADHKLDAVVRSGVDALVSADVSCLMHLRGRLEHRGARVRTLHLAEVLAGAVP